MALRSHPEWSLLAAHCLPEALGLACMPAHPTLPSCLDCPLGCSGITRRPQGPVPHQVCHPPPTPGLRKGGLGLGSSPTSRGLLVPCAPGSLGWASSSIICQGCPGPISATASLHTPCWQKPRRCSGRRWVPTLSPCTGTSHQVVPCSPRQGPAIVCGTSSMLLGGGSHHLLLTQGQVSHHFQQQKADLVSSSCRRKKDTRTGPERVRGIHQSKQHFGTSSIVVLATDGAADLPQWGSSWLEAAD